MITTLTAANAAARAIEAIREKGWGVRPLQEYFGKSKIQVPKPETNPK